MKTVFIAHRLKTVFIAHRLKGDFEENMKSALRWARWAIMEKSVAPVIPYAYLCLILNDSDAQDRNLGLSCSLRILRQCDELWVCGPSPAYSSEVWVEVSEAKANAIPVVYYTDLRLPEEYDNYKRIEVVESPRPLDESLPMANPFPGKIIKEERRADPT